MDSTGAKKNGKQSKGSRQLKYSIISVEKRVELIQMVLEQKLSIYQASRLLEINNATAKDIIRKYKKDGSIFVRKTPPPPICSESSSQQLPHPAHPSPPIEEVQSLPSRQEAINQPQLPKETAPIDSQISFMPYSLGMVFYYLM